MIQNIQILHDRKILHYKIVYWSFDVLIDTEESLESKHLCLSSVEEQV